MKSKLTARTNAIGWLFVLPAALLIFLMGFFPMISAFFLSLQTGKGTALAYGGLANYRRILHDPTFLTAIGNTVFYLVLQVPVMLLLALILAVMLNDPKLRFRGVYRTAIFLPCATSLVSYAVVFRQIFSTDGLINTLLLWAGLIAEPINYLSHPLWAKLVIVVALLWRWTGYNMIFYLSGLQGINGAVYEAATIDGASAVQKFSRITVPLLKPIILMTAILSTNGTLQIFDEVRNLTQGGPGNATLSVSNYIYDLTFKYVPQFGYASAISYTVFLIVAALTFLQRKAGEKK